MVLGHISENFEANTARTDIKASNIFKAILCNPKALLVAFNQLFIILYFYLYLPLNISFEQEDQGRM